MAPDVCVWWALAVCQVPTQLLSFPLLIKTEGEKKMEMFMGQDKNREITHQLSSQAKQTRPEEINLILLQINN